MKLALHPLPAADGRANENRPVNLDRPLLLVGRHPECDVRPAGTAKVSRRHCCVADASGRLRVRDLGSLNGTFVNDKPVRREAPLALGDVLRVGDVRYEVARRGASKPDPGHSGVISIAPKLRADLGDGDDPDARGGDDTEDARTADSQSDVVPLSL